jgi:membrane protein YqaA with SNARE-associated domain
MKTFVAWIQVAAAAIGGPGLFIIAFLDASFLSLPQISDLLVISMVIQHPYRMPYYVLMATAGSVAGCLTLYAIARKGGDAATRRFHTGTLTRARRLVERYGVMALVIPAILPPPAPFKVFVLMAGVSGMRAVPFALAIGVGRALRYTIVGLLSLWYGQAAVTFLEQHGRDVALWVGGGLGLAFALWLLWRYLRRRGTPLTSAV